MKLLIIDPNISLTSPSMKGVVRSLPQLRSEGWEIECWCWHADESLADVRVMKLPRFLDVHFLRSYAFSLAAMMRSWWRFVVRGEERPDVVYTVAWYLPDCDVCHVHFSPWDWELRQRLLGLRSLRDVIERCANAVSLVWCRLFLRITRCQRVLCVSRAVADDMRRVTPRLPIAVLPNSYDISRFNLGVRGEWRNMMREKLCYANDETVFAFASAGHYRRKGFFLAVAAVARLRRQGLLARLLVLGGQPAALNRLRRRLNEIEPNWRDWITFTGMVTDIERNFAAADGFLFPSYCEAFALVEVEAAACGLPLFLTRHHGSEMILAEGINGRFVEFEPEAMAAVLAEFVSGAWKPTSTVVPEALDTESYAERLGQELWAAVRNRTAISAVTRKAEPLLK